MAFHDRVCHILQKEVFSSEEYLDNLDITQAESAADLEEDLNYIRSVLKKLGGGTAWFDPGNTEGLSQLEDDFQVEHFTYAEDPVRAGQHKDIHALSVFSSGDIQTNASARIQQNLYFTDSWSDGWIIHPRYGTGYDFIHIAPRTGGVNEWSKGLKVYKADGRVEVLNYLRFVAPESAGTLIADFGFYGYTLYRDNVGPLGGTPGNRLWLHGPSYTTGETGVVIGPRGGADYFSVIRLRAQNLRFEAPATGTFDIIQANLFNRDGWTRSRGFIFVDEVAGHINTDGSLYRYAGQVYLTVDDNFYIRDSGATTPGFHFDSNNNFLGINKTNPNCHLDVNGNICYSGVLQTSTFRKYSASLTDGLSSYKRNAISFLTPYKVEVWDGTTWVDQTATLAPQFANLTKNIGAYYQTTLANVGDQYRVRVYFDLGTAYWSSGTFRVDVQWSNEYTAQFDLSSTSDFSADVVTIGPKTVTPAWDSAIEVPTNNTGLWQKRYVRFDITVTRTSSTLSPRIRELAFFHEAVIGKSLSETFPSHSWDADRRVLLYNRGSETNPALTWTSNNTTGISNPADNQVAVVTGSQRSALFTDDGSTIDNHLQVGNFTNKGTVYGDGNIYVAGEYHGIYRDGKILLHGDWTGLIYSITPGGSVTYDPNRNAVRIDGISVWIKIRLRIPVSTRTVIYAIVEAESNSTTIDGTFYAGAICLDENFSELTEDSINRYHYFVAAAAPSPKSTTSAAYTTATYYGSIAGFNDPTDTTMQNRFSFEPRTQFVDFVLIHNYLGTSNETIYIKSIEIFVITHQITRGWSGVGNMRIMGPYAANTSSPAWVRVGRYTGLNNSTATIPSQLIDSFSPGSGTTHGRVWVIPGYRKITAYPLDVSFGSRGESLVSFEGDYINGYRNFLSAVVGYQRPNLDTIDVYVRKPIYDIRNYAYVVSVPGGNGASRNSIGYATNTAPSYYRLIPFYPVIDHDDIVFTTPPPETDFSLISTISGRVRPLGVAIEPTDTNYSYKDMNVMVWSMSNDDYSSGYLMQIQHFSSYVSGSFIAHSTALVHPALEETW